MVDLPSHSCEVENQTDGLHTARLWLLVGNMDSYATPSMHILYQEAGFGAAAARSKSSGKERGAGKQKRLTGRHRAGSQSVATTERRTQAELGMAVPTPATPPPPPPPRTTTTAKTTEMARAGSSRAAEAKKKRDMDGHQQRTSAAGGGAITESRSPLESSASSASTIARRMLGPAAPPLTPFQLNPDTTTTTTTSSAPTRGFIAPYYNSPTNKPLPASPPTCHQAAGATSGTTAADVNADTGIDADSRLVTSTSRPTSASPSAPAAPTLGPTSPLAPLALPTTLGPRRRGRASSWSRLANNGLHSPVSLLSSPPTIIVDPGYLALRLPRPQHHAVMVLDPAQRSSPYQASAGVATAMTSPENPPPSSSHESSLSASASAQQRAAPTPLIVRNGRTYIHDENLSYPLPVDLAELHRQSLRTLLLFQLFGGPIISNVFSANPPHRILEVGCGSGFWSMMCHRYFAQHGHTSISFTGMDIVPLCGTGPDPNSKPDKDMNWRYVQHDMRRTPWPFQDGEFDLVMVKDMSTTSPAQFSQDFMDEYLRVLRPGGVLEIWETDLAIRMLRPHVPVASSNTATASSSPAPVLNEDNINNSINNSTSTSTNTTSEDEDDASRLGAYVVTANTPLSAPLNPFLVEYNGWLSKALDKRYISAVPCTLIGPMLLQEDGLIEVRSKRLAVPLSEVRWEREGVGGVVTKDGKSYIDSMAMKGKGKAADPKAGKSGKSLTAAQAAIRRTALETSVGLIQALEPMLRDTSGKSQDEWDGWTGKMMNDLLREGGTSWGECLEIGAWSARKRSS